MTKNDPRNFETNRTKAIEWWNSLTPLSQITLKNEFISEERNINSLTGREIENIWKLMFMDIQRNS